MKFEIKNKKLSYVLLPAVLIIWVLLFVRVVHFFKKGDDVEVSEAFVSKVKTKIITKDTFNLIASYKDPFLGDLPQNAYMPQQEQESIIDKRKKELEEKKKENLRKKNPIKWPEIDYYGIVKNKVSGQKVILIKIGEKNHLLEQNEIINRVKILAIYEDSVRMEYRGEEKSIPKE